MFYRKTVLDNGITVISEPMDSVRSATLGIWFAVGSRDESPEEAGLSHFMEHMMFKGTPTRSARDIAEQFDEMGALFNAEHAITEACLVRFRPIMMTSFAALAGSFPIALGLGAGAESRRPLGLAVVGGLVVSQLLTLYITPVIYIYMDKFTSRFRHRKDAHTHAPAASGEPAMAK